MEWKHFRPFHCTIALMWTYLHRAACPIIDPPVSFLAAILSFRHRWVPPVVNCNRFWRAGEPVKEGGPRFINTHTWASSDTIELPKIESLSVTRGTPRASLDLSGSAASRLQTVDIVRTRVNSQLLWSCRRGSCSSGLSTAISYSRRLLGLMRSFELFYAVTKQIEEISFEFTRIRWMGEVLRVLGHFCKKKRKRLNFYGRKFDKKKYFPTFKI